MAATLSNAMSLLFLLIAIHVYSSSADSSSSGWVLKDDYTPANFFDKFSFWTAADPTHGHVQYVDRKSAQASGLIQQRNGGIYMGVDYTNKAPKGRRSVRLTSNAVYNTGTLMLLDLKHMPVGCGTWPAYWTVGPNWPAGGEIDIIEGVHNQVSNAMTLHTSEGCTISPSDAFSGSITTNNCFVNAAGQWNNAGCSITTPRVKTYGKGLNQNGGGVYAMAWQKASIRIWFFPRGKIPDDITAGNPKPVNWGKPLSQFQGGCDIPKFFQNNQIVFDTTFCGDWAGNVWQQSGCQSAQYQTCEDYVSNNPASFKNAFWQINYLKVYSRASASVSPVSSPALSLPSSSSPSLTTPAYVPVTVASAQDQPNNTPNNTPKNNSTPENDNDNDNNDSANSNANNDIQNNPTPNDNNNEDNITDGPISPNVSGSLLVEPSGAASTNNLNKPAPKPGRVKQPKSASNSAANGASGSTQASSSGGSSLNLVVGPDGRLEMGGRKRAAAGQPQDMPAIAPSAAPTLTERDAAGQPQAMPAIVPVVASTPAKRDAAGQPQDMPAIVPSAVPTVAKRDAAGQPQDMPAIAPSPVVDGTAGPSLDARSAAAEAPVEEEAAIKGEEWKAFLARERSRRMRHRRSRGRL